jgi:hypothetical protein
VRLSAPARACRQGAHHTVWLWVCVCEYVSMGVLRAHLRHQVRLTAPASTCRGTRPRGEHTLVSHALLLFHSKVVLHVCTQPSHAISRTYSRTYLQPVDTATRQDSKGTHMQLCLSHPTLHSARPPPPPPPYPIKSSTVSLRKTSAPLLPPTHPVVTPHPPTHPRGLAHLM